MQANDDEDSVKEQMLRFSRMQANDLRAECRRRKASPASLNKAACLEAIRVSLETEMAITAAAAVTGPSLQQHASRKTIDCVFRLLNVLFSDTFYERFAAHGDLASRCLIHTHSTGCVSLF